MTAFTDNALVSAKQRWETDLNDKLNAEELQEALSLIL